jgi:hypothetical protein
LPSSEGIETHPARARVATAASARTERPPFPNPAAAGKPGKSGAPGRDNGVEPYGKGNGVEPYGKDNGVEPYGKDDGVEAGGAGDGVEPYGEGAGVKLECGCTIDVALYAFSRMFSEPER